MDYSTRDYLSPLGQNIPASPWDFTDQPVGAQYPQPMIRPSGESPLHLLIVVAGEKVEDKVSVSESVDLELSPADRFEQNRVLSRPRTKGTDALALPTSRLADRLNHFSQKTIHLDRSKRLQISFIGDLRDLRPPVQIRHPLAHSLPRESSLGLSLFVTIHLEGPWVIESRLHPQHPSFFIIDFEYPGIIESGPPRVAPK